MSILTFPTKTMNNQPPPMPPPAGYDSWISYTIDWVDELLTLLNDDSRKPVVAAAKAELESLRKSHADLELKCALANAHVFNLKRALEQIMDEKTIHLEMRDIAAEALKGLE